MERKPRILIVDDDPRLRKLLQRYLLEQDMDVESVANGEQLDARLTHRHIDLIVLDLMLPGEDGLRICQRLRGGNCDIPIIMLTARGDEIDRILGLEMGADDYLPKPCNPRELLARIKAVLRRKPLCTPGMLQDEAQWVCFGDNRLNLGTRELRTASGSRRLTSGEFGVLKALVEHANKPLSRDRLMTLSRGRDYQAYDRSIDVQISQLRKMIEPDPSQPRYLQTVWGTGYVFVPDKKAAD